MKPTSIILTHWCQNEFRSQQMQTCLRSLQSTTRNLPVEIIAGDNGGSLADSMWLVEQVHSRGIQHYFRNYSNLYFGWVRNIGVAVSSGEYLCFTDNDIEFFPGWLEWCVEILETFSDKKYLVTPLRTDRQHRQEKCWSGELEHKGEKFLLNTRAGSNCWVMRRKDFEEIGKFENHQIAGSHWNDAATRKGYLMVTREQNPLAKDIGFKKGYNHTQRGEIYKVLANGEKLAINL